MVPKAFDDLGDGESLKKGPVHSTFRKHFGIRPFAKVGA